MSGQNLDHGGKNLPAVSRAEHPLARSIRVGHHAQYVSIRVENACDIAQGSIRVGFRSNFSARGCVAKGDSVLRFQATQFLFCAEVIALHVPDGNLQHLTLDELVGEGTICGFNAQVNLLADVFEAGVPHQRAGQQSGFGKDLEAVADAQHQSAAGSKPLHRLHDGRKPRDGAGAKVISVGEASRNQDGIDAGQILGIVPKECYGLVSHFSDDVERVVVAIGTRKDENPEFHDSRLSASKRGGFPIPGLMPARLWSQVTWEPQSPRWYTHKVGRVPAPTLFTTAEVSMSGHSKWATIKHKKGALDADRKS